MELKVNELGIEGIEGLGGRFKEVGYKVKRPYKIRVEGL